MHPESRLCIHTQYIDSLLRESDWIENPTGWLRFERPELRYSTEIKPPFDWTSDGFLKGFQMNVLIQSE